MTFSDYPSKLLENAVNEFASLPGIGKKTAFRLVMHLLRQNESDVERFGESIIKFKKEIKYCKICYNISDTEICDICSDKSRDRSIICVVENIRDVIAIENTAQYRGVYHVLGGIISPMDGVGPSDLNIDQLEEKVKTGGVAEVILALSTTMEGDTTNYYIYRRLLPYDIKITSLSRGVAIGDELEYTDEITLGRSIVNRTPFEIPK
ncbi:MAG: recombination mediator RecR [Bacteroidota bacterium]|nr:recombination mediator RecR [Bacteroidota bacterium]